MSEWLKETGCKPVGLAYAGSNPAPPTGRVTVDVAAKRGDRAPLLRMLGAAGLGRDGRAARSGRRAARDRRGHRRTQRQTWPERDATGLRKHRENVGRASRRDAGDR